MKRMRKPPQGPPEKQSKAILKCIFLAVAAISLTAAGLLWADRIHPPRHPPTRNACVLLVHGLARSSFSMRKIEHALREKGFAVIDIDYASTRESISEVARGVVAQTVARCERDGFERIHFVTHSMGAIVVRSYLQNGRLPRGSRIVMLAPPNGGSELADWALDKYPRLSRLAGPNIRQLGTDEGARVSRLAPIEPQVGILIGKKSRNPYFSRILPGSDDGRVSVEKAKLEGMKDFLVMPCNHTTILFDREVRRQVVHFLEKGWFSSTP